MNDISFNQSLKTETYYYQGDGKIDYIETITTYPILNFLYLGLKLAILIWVVFYFIKKR